MSSDEETLTTVVEQVEKQRNKRKDKLSKKKKHRKAVDSDNEQHFDISELMERIDAFVQTQNEHNALIKSLTDDSKEQTKLIMSLTEKSNEQNELIKQLTDGSTEPKKKSKKKSSSSSDEESKPRKTRKPQPKNAWIMFQSTNKQKINDFLEENKDDEMFEGITDGRKRRQLATKHLWEELTEEDHAHYKNMGLELFATEHPKEDSDEEDNKSNTTNRIHETEDNEGDSSEEEQVSD